MKIDSVTVTNIVYLKSAEEIASLFSQHGLSFVFLKGISLLETAYPDISKRFMSDIDILVPPKHLKQAITLLKTMGFESVDQTLSFLKKGNIWIRIDLHDQLWFFDQKTLWQEVITKDQTNRLPILSPELNLLHIILHALVQDGVVSTNSIHDGKRLLDYYAPEWSWNKFKSLVEVEGWTKVCSLYLKKLNEEYPKLVPDKMWQQWGFNTLIEQQLLNSFYQHGYQRMVLFQDSFFKKMRLMLKIFCPSFAFLQFRYSKLPHILFFFWPLVRAGDFFLKGVKICFLKMSR